VKRPPKADAVIASELSARFRAGELWSFSWDHDRGCWSTWTSEHDWLHTERKGSYRCSCCAPEMSLQHGPRDWRDRAALLAWLGLPAQPERRLTKVQLVARLRRLPDLPAEAVAILDAA
jgi:hypothetical protein